MISEKNIYATIIAFYLARYDKEAILHLNFSSSSEVSSKCAEILDVKRNYIKLRRDEFYPVYNWRRGWNNRPMAKIICRTIDLFGQLTEPDMRALVTDILKHNKHKSWDWIVSRLQGRKNDVRCVNYAARVMTGKRAENYLRTCHANMGLSIPGTLEDGTKEGYDCLITNDTRSVCIEVKGLPNDRGGILFTGKEWNTAMEYGDRYYLHSQRSRRKFGYSIHPQPLQIPSPHGKHKNDNPSYILRY